MGKKETVENKQTSLQETAETKPLVKVIFDRNLNRDDCDYDVTFDAESYTQLLRESGLSDDQIKKVKIAIKRRPSLGERVWDRVFLGNTGRRSFGVYDRLTKTISIFTDYCWDRYRDSQLAIVEAEEPFYGDKEKGRDYLNEYLNTTKKLKCYLDAVGENRGRSHFFLLRLLKISNQRVINESILHETKHLVDDITGVYGTYRRDKNVLKDNAGKMSFHDLYYAYYANHESEVAAREFASRMIRNPQWGSIINIDHTRRERYTDKPPKGAGIIP